MNYILKNEQLTATLSSLGAELISVQCKGNCEYIWQGDEKYWSGQAPVLFPICGRFFGTKYTYRGKEYSMGTHGFARNSEFEAVSVSTTEVTFLLIANDQTRAEYPFEFEFYVTYSLNGARLDIKHEIKNKDEKTLIATVGAHPGFNVPLDNGSFDDWYLEFSEECYPDELVFSKTCFNTGLKRPLNLESSRILRLSHDLFDIDGIFMSNTSRSVTLKSDKSERFVRVEYPDMPYLGLWHAPRSDAPYVCIEPWCGLPSYDGETEALENKNDTFRLAKGSSKKINYAIIFG